MPKNLSAQNNFIRGLITEATGLNFPENACTDTSNCVFSLIGDVTRRPGINLEDNYDLIGADVDSLAITSYRWLNAGGDGETQVVVLQIGKYLSFYESTNSTVLKPLSTTNIGSFDFTIYQASDNTNDISQTECQFAAGNGYLFVFHPDCNPFFCSLNDGNILSYPITVQIRDFNGYYPEPGNPPIQLRPSALSNEHNYNLQNQGWVGVPTWTATVTTSLSHYFTLETSGPYNGYWVMNVGEQTYTVPSGLSNVTVSQPVTIAWSVSGSNFSSGNSETSGQVSGDVVSYSGTTLVLDVTGLAVTAQGGAGSPTNDLVLTIFPGASNNTLNTFFSDEGVYPSNSDIWYTFKDDTGVFNPSGTYANVGITTTPAPRGHFILNAFNMNQTGVSAVSGLTNLSTDTRPRTGCWFQGRVFYTGVNSSQAQSGDQNFYTWSENLYFSQVIQANDITSFGYCYQTNDPTDEVLFDILPTDGGVITIQGCGNIFRLFPIQNGMLIFAANGVWFLTGSQGIGFTATDYTITKISSVQSVSSTSFIDVMGLPFFWNEEGIYRVVTSNNQGLMVEPLTVGTILSFYNNIPLDSKVYARGDYDPINYVVKWVYRSTQEAGISNRYQFDSVLNFNIYNKAFYPYSISNTAGTPQVAGLFYLNYTNSLTAPEPTFKYIATYHDSMAFAEENDETTWLDWNAIAGQNYTSYFTTGYNLHGKGVFKWQPTYVYMFSRNDVPFAYTIQGVWDYSINPNSGRISTTQTVSNNFGEPNYGMLYRRHKIRGHGVVLQITVSSVQGQPFDIIGWTTLDQIDAGV